jgi:hypothetical protein
VANEQVRKLYRRNFELKRKDYLHDEARGNSKEIPVNYLSTADHTIGSIQNERMEKGWINRFQTLKTLYCPKSFVRLLYVVDAIELSIILRR